MNESYTSHQMKYIITLNQNMVEGNISQEFKWKNIDEARSYFVEEIKQNDLMSKKHKKVCATLNYIEHLLILASVVTFQFLLLLL